MSSRLNRDKPFGKVTPPTIEAGTDRPAFYNQDGRFYDAHDRLIVAGETAPPPPSVPVVAQKPAVAEPAKEGGAPAEVAATAEDKPAAPPAADAPAADSISKLLAKVRTLPFASFKKQAKALLGDDCPAGKDAIIAALKEAQAKGDTPKADAPAPVKVSGKDIDLAAWGRGQKDYLFADVRKAIKTKDARVCTTMKDAVEHLIDTKVITAQDARSTN